MFKFGSGKCVIILLAFIFLITCISELAVNTVLAYWMTIPLEETKDNFFYPGMFLGTVGIAVIASDMRIVMVV